MPTTGDWRALPYPNDDGSDPANVPADIKALAVALRKVAMWDSGPASSLPAAGRPGFRYYETDNGLELLDIGTAWIIMNPTIAGDGDPGTATLRSLGSGANQAAAGNDARLSDRRLPRDGSVTAPSLDDSLVPSRGAGAGTEAVRALGTDGQSAAAGNDGRFPTTTQKAALVGTSGAPGAGNKFVTDADLRLPGLGFMMEYAGIGDPNASWLLADGRALSRTTYAALFAIIRTIHGAGDGVNTFSIPDARDRVSLAPDNMGTAMGAAGRITGSPRGLGNTGGIEFHTHNGDIPFHTHTGVAPDHLHTAGSLVIPDHTHGIGIATRGSGNGYAAGGGESVAFTNHVHPIAGAGAIGVTGSTGSADRSLSFTTGGPSTTAFTTAQASTLQPYVVLNKIIRVI